MDIIYRWNEDNVLDNIEHKKHKLKNLIIALDKISHENRLKKALRHVNDGLNLITSRASDIDSI